MHPLRGVLKTQRSPYTLEQTNSTGSAFLSKCEIQNLIIERPCQSASLPMSVYCAIAICLCIHCEAFNGLNSVLFAIFVELFSVLPVSRIVLDVTDTLDN